MSHFQFVLKRTKQYKRSLYQGRFCLKFDRLLFAQGNRSLSVKNKLKSRYFFSGFLPSLLILVSKCSVTYEHFASVNFDTIQNAERRQDGKKGQRPKISLAVSHHVPNV